MFSFFVRKMQPAAIAAAIVCFAGSGQLSAQVKLPNVTYTCSGTFSTTLVSGNDAYKLAGEPFTIYVVGNEATKPVAHGAGYGAFAGLKMKGKVTSALDTSGFTIESAHTFLVMAIGNPSYDVFNLTVPVKVLGQDITIAAKLTLPPGSLAKWLIYPFPAPVSLSSSTGTVAYSDKSGSTTLSIAVGTLNAVKGAPGAASIAAGLETSGHSMFAVAGDRFAIMPKGSLSQLFV